MSSFPRRNRLKSALVQAIELLGFPDPMIRISAQTTILNIYKVQDKRARSYALNEEVLFSMLEVIVRIMRDQFLLLEKQSLLFLKLHNDKAEREVLLRCEQALEDAFIGAEDWLYYIQDILNLTIPDLQQALISHILSAFIRPVLLTRVVDAARYLAPGESP